MGLGALLGETMLVVVDLRLVEVAHNNLLGDVKNMGAVYVDEDVVVDKDLVTGRAGPVFHTFARRIIDMLAGDDETWRPPAQQRKQRSQ